MKVKAEAMRTLVERAMRGADALPIADLASLNDAPATALRRFDSRRAGQAAHMASLLRQALNQQLEFADLLRA